MSYFDLWAPSFVAVLQLVNTFCLYLCVVVAVVIVGISLGPGYTNYIVNMSGEL